MSWNDRVARIRAIQKPEKEMLLLASMHRKPELRLYRVQKLAEPVYVYNSSMSGGQRHFTKKKIGISGEKVDIHPYHWLVRAVHDDGESFIDFFRTWGWILSWLKMCEAEIVEVEYI